MSEKEKCPQIGRPGELCSLLGHKAEYVYGIANETHKYYQHSRIPKKRGGFRELYEPLPELKKMQTWILHHILDLLEPSPYAKAYRKGYSVKDNAKFHRRQKKVLSLDIEGFFDHIRRYPVFRVFLDAGYKKDVAMLLAALCCRNGCLPQGAPTSAALSNLVMLGFDAKVGAFCRERGIRYTRYADDMTFSGDFEETEVIRFVKEECGKLSMKLNREKTRVRKQGQQQEVTGIVVNEKTQLPESERKKIRQEMYYIRKYGLESHLRHLREGLASGKNHMQEASGNGKERRLRDTGTSRDLSKERYLSRLLGRISYALFINPRDEAMREYKAIVTEMIKAEGSGRAES